MCQLAEIIAAHCDTHGETFPGQAFLVRANELLGDATVGLSWAGQGIEDRALDNRDALPWDSYERARYSSQQFVENMCSAGRMTDGLLSDVERSTRIPRVRRMVQSISAICAICARRGSDRRQKPWRET